VRDAARCNDEDTTRKGTTSREASACDVAYAIVVTFVERSRGAGPGTSVGCAPWVTQLTCLPTSFVISNMFTEALPPKTAFSVASALIMRRFLASCSLFFLM